MNYYWNCVPNLKTTIYFFSISIFKTIIARLGTETGQFCIFIGSVSVLYHFLFIFA